MQNVVINYFLDVISHKRSVQIIRQQILLIITKNLKVCFDIFRKYSTIRKGKMESQSTV